MTTEPRFVTRAELNGQIVLLLAEVRTMRTEVRGDLSEVRGEVGEVYKVVREQNEQFCDLLNREIDKREGCARDHGLRFAGLDKRMGKVEKCAAVQGVKLQVPGWVWKAAVGVLGVAGVIVGILAAVHVI